MMPAATFQRHDHLGEIVIDSPPMNLFSQALIADLRKAVDETAGNDVRAVLLRANGDAFSAGADVSIFTRLDESSAAELMATVLSLIGAIEELPVPTVALVHGRCFAGALEVALACDLIWAAAGTQLGQVRLLLTRMLGGYWMAVATRRRSSGVIRWSWSSSPASSCTHFTLPLNWLLWLV